MSTSGTQDREKAFKQLDHSTFIAQELLVDFPDKTNLIGSQRNTVKKMIDAVLAISDKNKVVGSLPQRQLRTSYNSYKSNITSFMNNTHDNGKISTMKDELKNLDLVIDALYKGETVPNFS